MKRVMSILLTLAVGILAVAANAAEPHKVVFIAGKLDGHPPDTHEYERSVLLLQHTLDTAPNVSGIMTEAYFDGWPKDPSTLEDADTIVIISGGCDQVLTDHPLMVGDRLRVVGEQMDRGCGLVVIHWTTFAPRDMAGEQFLEWVGGYFDYESGPPPRHWYSAIQTATTNPVVATPDHPISRGLTPFELHEEYYYKIRFRENDPRFTPILNTPIPNVPDDQTVAWAVQRDNGGRGFGFTGGHFYKNYFIESFRRMILNAILWTAHVEVPEGGVAIPEDEPIRALILTGHNASAHDWRATTPMLKHVLDRDPRYLVTYTEDPEFLASPELMDYDVVVQNYCNWDRHGLSEAAQKNFARYLSEGGGLSLIHFANGAWHPSLPDNAESAWPEYWQHIVRRTWNHPTSAHDPYGTFTVNVSDVDHPITEGATDFETVDELYFNQAGDAPIEPLITARSTVTGKDEPLAWVYTYGEGKVFQTLLGHAAESIGTDGAARLIRRGTTWAAGRDPIDFARVAGRAPTAIPVPEPAGPSDAAK